MSFTVNLPPIPMILSQSEKELRITWRAIDNVQNYATRLRYADSGEIVSDVVGVGILNVTHATLTNIPPGLRYIFEACSVNPAGESCGSLSISGRMYFFIS